MTQWQSARPEIEGSLDVLHCVLEQDTSEYSLLITGLTKEDIDMTEKMLTGT